MRDLVHMPHPAVEIYNLPNPIDLMSMPVVLNLMTG